MIRIIFLGTPINDDVANLMAVGVIQIFEMIDIDHENRKSRAKRTRPRHFFSQPFLKGSASR